ncbi:para-hydroxybenzoate-polyprenyltransferase [Ephemerocybe angulata]|uniref:Para-hydroxybenzoate-polyprenyltransferase n=1 Tax=Ephemerocybe angulata TaxID=980116 RepID=A0A8H6IEH3_9AGAR|nr:para-hydroxybenzoate-polyprenyltransferase [Tulosesus angulatus]
MHRFLRHLPTSSLRSSRLGSNTSLFNSLKSTSSYLYSRTQPSFATTFRFNSSLPLPWSITMASYALHLPVTTPLTYISLCGIGALVMRGAGCTINDMWDKNLDKSVASSLSLVNRLYPPHEVAITHWPQAVLGLAFDWAVCLPLYAGGVCWTLVYDSIYAHQDKRDDVNVGIKSTALLFGERSRLILSGLSASAISLVSYAGYLNHHTEAFYAGVGLAAFQLARILYKTDFDSRESCWKGFTGSGWAGFWIWMGALADYGLLLAA